MFTTRNRRFAQRVVFFGVLLLSTSWPMYGQALPKPCKNSYSFDQEVALGQQASAEIFRQMPILPESNPVAQYVEALGEKLAAQAPGERWPYHFYVANQADVNAFALPGGPIFINMGTLEAAETEAQLAGVMAHEISHVVLRHATCNMTKQQTPRMLAGLGQIAAGILVPGVGGALAQTGIGTVAGLGFLKMSRDAEKQADLLGVQILYDSGYDPRGMSQFFEIIQGKYGQGGAQFMSDHPNPGNRTEYVNEAIARLPQRKNEIRTTAAFKKMKAEIKGMKVYTAKEIASGAWRQQQPNAKPVVAVRQPVSFAPSGIWQRLETAQFLIQYPGNWKATAKGSSAMIAPVGGVNAESADNVAVAYGALINVFVPNSGGDIDASFRQLVSALIQQNSGMKQSGQIQKLDAGLLHGVDARSVELTGSSPLIEGGEPATERDWLVGIARPDGSLSTIVFVAPEDDADALRPTFETMLSSFQLR
jgi:beta-barrel assembly-enhancing protease